MMDDGVIVRNVRDRSRRRRREPRENNNMLCRQFFFFKRRENAYRVILCGGGGGARVHLPSNIFLVAPKLWPACVAPLLLPACSPMTPSPARSCSSVQSRLFSSDGLGPNDGPLHSGCLCACGGGKKKKKTIIRPVVVKHTHARDTGSLDG